MALSPSVAARIAAAKARVAAEAAAKSASPKTNPSPNTNGHLGSLSVSPTPAQTLANTQVLQTAPIWNPQQLQAIELAKQGKSFCLIGAAGTGKTTVTQEIIKVLQQSPLVSPIPFDTGHLKSGTPGIVVCGFTNKAVNNIQKKLPEHLKGHCLTIHKLLEFAPVFNQITASDGTSSTTMSFEPTYHEMKKLPHTSSLISEESSMTGIDLWAQLTSALPKASRTQFIFLGDLNQLPPVFGPSILGFKLLELPVVELTHVYRQALESPIISLATAIRTNETLKGNATDLSRIPTNLKEAITVDKGEHGLVTITPWKKRVPFETALHHMKKFLPSLIDSGRLNLDEDVILCPFNKSFGTVELNKIIADHRAVKEGAVVHEIRARYELSYYAIGDRVIYDRHEAIVTDIFKTPGYLGKPTMPASAGLDRWGKFHKDRAAAAPQPMELTEDEINALIGGAEQSQDHDIFDVMDQMVESDEDSKNLASHTIKLFVPDLDRTVELRSAGDINALTFTYCRTVHKSQGSEWNRVYILLHNSHAKGTLMSRELLYTAVTRAKKELHIICEGDHLEGRSRYTNSLSKAADSPVIKGITLQEKARYFRGKLDSYVAAMD